MREPDLSRERAGKERMNADKLGLLQTPGSHPLKDPALPVVRVVSKGKLRIPKHPREVPCFLAI